MGDVLPAAYDQLLHDLKLECRMLFVVGLVVMLVSMMQSREHGVTRTTRRFGDQLRGVGY